MGNIVYTRKSNSGKTVATIEETASGAIGKVIFTADDGGTDEDVRDFATVRDAEGWLELTYMFMVGVHADM